MRVVYMGPDPWSSDWPSKVFTEFYNEIRNGIAYDFEIAISPASGIEGVATLEKGVYVANVGGEMIKFIK